MAVGLVAAVQPRGMEVAPPDVHPCPSARTNRVIVVLMNL